MSTSTHHATGVSRRGAWLVLAGALAVLVVFAAWLVPWQWVPGGELVPARATDVFTQAQIDRAEAYSRTARLIGWSSYAISLVLAGVLGFTRLGSMLTRRLTGRLRWWLAVPVGTLLLLLAGRLVTLPLALLARRHRLDNGLTKQGLGGWLADQGLSLLVSWAVASALLLLVVGLARRSPRWWFAWAGLAAAGLTVLLSFLYPVLVEPLFNRFTPMADGALRQSIFELADAEGVDIEDVLVADASKRTTTLNAYVSGFGSTRRVVVYDNLVDETTAAQVRSVVAHELGHAKHRDVLLGTGLGALGGLAGMAALGLLLDSAWLRRRTGISGPGDPVAVALVLALVAFGGLLASPAENTVSRAIEARADRAALAATDDSVTFVEVERELALASLADPTPPKVSQLWFGSHPTVLQRVGLPGSLERAAR